jgi:hypothetical protein
LEQEEKKSSVRNSLKVSTLEIMSLISQKKQNIKFETSFSGCNFLNVSVFIFGQEDASRRRFSIYFQTGKLEYEAFFGLGN